MEIVRETKRAGTYVMIRVFIGTEPMHWKAAKVIEYSIQKNTAEDVDIHWLSDLWKTNRATGFSAYRYLIPELCNYKGYAIYLDVDMLVLGDLSELQSYKRKGKWCCTERNPNKSSRKGRFRDEVSIIDCSAFRNVLPSRSVLQIQGKESAKRILIDGEFFSETIPREWNAQVLTPESKLLHYTRLDTQPWCPDTTKEDDYYKSLDSQITIDIFWEYFEEANKHL